MFCGCFTGHRNKNWPIKSSFYHGPDYEIGALWKVQKKEEGGIGSEASEEEEEEDEKEAPVPHSAFPGPRACL